MHGVEQCHFENSFSVINKALGIAEMIGLYKLSQSENHQEEKKSCGITTQYANSAFPCLGISHEF